MIAHLGVLIPAHNEEDEIAGCLDSVIHSISQVPENRVQFTCRIVVVVDACTDNTAGLVGKFSAREADVVALNTRFRNVGKARNFASNYFIQFISSLEQINLAHAWIAFTDADSRVPADWIASHLKAAEAGVDCLVGTVAPRPETGSAELISKWHAQHELLDDHSYIFGANLGLRGSYLETIGGIPPLSCGEDTAVVSAVLQAGGHVERTDTCRVLTSARLRGRAQGGFSSFLQRLL